MTVNPTSGLELPAVRGRRDRIAPPDEAARLIAALPVSDRALWATATYGGLRRGELRGLRWTDVNLARGTIRVERSWDPQAGEVKPKSYNGTRLVPIASVLRDYLIEHKAATPDAEVFVFSTAGGLPFDPATITRRADKAWTAAKLSRITLHECRHTFASLMIAAGVNPKALSTFMGHASITITIDRYGHLFPALRMRLPCCWTATLSAPTRRLAWPRSPEPSRRFAICEGRP